MALQIRMHLTDAPKEKPQDSELGFGKIFTDHMFLMEYSQTAAGTTRASNRFTTFPCTRRARFCITAPKYLKA